MKFIETLKSLFNKNISILSFQREDLVSFVKLKNNSIKINASVEVEEGYNFIIVYYNKVCDILQAGNHKFNEDTIPKLYRFSKTPFGLKALTTRSIDCDAYYVNLKMFNNNHFKTIDRVIAFSDKQKIKVKLDGTFSMQVCDTLKFMKALCNDYAVIRNKKTIREICSTVGYEVSKALNGKNFSVDDYIFNRDKITATIEELVNNHTNTFGIQVSGFKIGQVIINKKYLNDVQLDAIEKEESLKQNIETMSEQSEDNIESSQKELGVIYAGCGEEKQASAKGENSTSISSEGKESGIVAKDSKSLENNKLTKDFEKQLEESANKILENTNFKKEEDIIIKETINTKPKNAESTIDSVSIRRQYVGTSYYGGKSAISNSINNPYGNGSKDYYKQPEPKIIGEENFSEDSISLNQTTEEKSNKSIHIVKKVKQDIKDKKDLNKEIANGKHDIVNKPKKRCSVCGENIEEDNAKFCEKCGNKINNYKKCACCGAKNLGDAKSCCVCKSVLD